MILRQIFSVSRSAPIQSSLLRSLVRRSAVGLVALSVSIGLQAEQPAAQHTGDVEEGVLAWSLQQAKAFAAPQAPAVIPSVGVSYQRVGVDLVLLGGAASMVNIGVKL